jgi:hypothetical protein
MLGSDPDDGDVLEMGPQRPPRSWSVGRRARLALAGVCALLLVAGGTLAGLRLSSPGPANPALAKLIAEVTTVPVSAAGSAGAVAYQGALPAASAGPNSSSSLSAASAASSADSIASANSHISASSTGSFAAVSAGSGSVLLFNGYATPVGAKSRPLTFGGKPEVLYVATGYCPYCAAQSWPLIIALSHFGQFTGLNVSRTPTFEGIPPVDGWTFASSSYQSRYLAFAPVETYSNVLVSPTADPGSRTSYRKLQSLTQAQQAAVHQLDVGGQTPFTDFGGKLAETGSDIVPTALTGLSWTQIAADLRRPASTPGAAILFTAAVLTAELCQLTGNRPAAACAKP